MKRLIWIVVVLAVAGGGYFGYQYFQGQEVQRQLERAKAEAEARGWTLTYSDAVTEGFPVANAVMLKDAALVSAGGVLIKAGDVRVLRDPSAPGTFLAEMPASSTIEVPIDGITRQQAPGLPERVKVAIASEELRVILQMADGAVPAVAITAKSLSASVDQADAPVKQLIDAKDLELVSDPVGKTRKLRLKAADLMLDTRQVGSPQNITMVAQYADVQIGATVAALDLDGFSDAYAALAEKLIDGAFQSSNQSITISMVNGGAPTSLTWVAGPQTGLFGIDKGIVNYDSEDRDVTITFDHRAMGLTVDAKALFYQRRLQFPLTGAGIDPKEGALRIAVEDFAPGDGAWAMLDPQNQLPREPMDLLLDTSSTMRLAAGPGGLPAEFSNISLMAFSLSALGATAKAEGDVEILQPINLPLGEFKVELTGANALIENLTKAGLLPADVTEMANAILKVYARSEEGTDRHETEVKFTNGGILIGGLPLDGPPPDPGDALDPTREGAATDERTPSETTNDAPAEDGTTTDPEKPKE